MKRVILAIILSGVLLIGTHATAQDHHAHGDNNSKTESLVKIMQGMNTNLNALTNAIIFEDYPAIHSTAHDIANHPGIAPHDLHMLFERLGEQKQAFIACDTAVHDLAKEISRAGKQEDMVLVLEKYTAMITKTIECHSKYKPKT